MSTPSEIQALQGRQRNDKSDMKVCLLGASFETANLGVSALAESSVKLILHRWPDAEVTFIGSGFKPSCHRLSLMGREISVSTIPIRYSMNIFMHYHMLWFVFYGLVSKIMPAAWFKKYISGRNPYFRIIYESDVVVDITGGDSFSDIYGMGRFVRSFLHKWLIIFLKKQMILLPQTYGPFTKKISRMMARYVMKHALFIYSRDLEGIEYIQELFRTHKQNGKIRFAPDVAFLLDSRKPDNTDIALIESTRKSGTVLIGLNISGLLFNGGYTHNNMFGLRTDYKELIDSVIELFMEDKRNVIVLVPHVFTPDGYVESDPHACRQVYEKMRIRYAERILMLQGKYNQNEIKYLIGKCDFFLGSRMHSCIAALSQCIPAVGLAYSKKFQGVFETVDVGDNVIDIRYAGKQEILTRISEIYSHRKAIVRKLKVKMPQVQQQLITLFDEHFPVPEE